jgi:hypothetical protein
MREVTKRYPIQMWNNKDGLLPPKQLSQLMYLVDELLIRRVKSNIFKTEV